MYLDPVSDCLRVVVLLDVDGCPQVGGQLHWEPTKYRPKMERLKSYLAVL